MTTWVVSRQLEKPYLESVPSSEFGPILAFAGPLWRPLSPCAQGKPAGTRLRYNKKNYPWKRTLQRPRLGRGGHRGVCREWLRGDHSGTLRAELGEGHVIQPVSAPGRRVRRVGAEFRRGHPPRETENLKN